MPTMKQMQVAGWGQVPRAECSVYRPEKQREIVDIYQHHKGSLLARGCGRSYGDASLNPEGVISSVRLNRFLAFDTVSGAIRMQGGVTLAEILEVAIPKGWFLPVIPGTQFATIGGAIAADVHGKNHYKQGCISHHVLSLQLRIPSGERIECSPFFEQEVFMATAGGMGLTGFIEEVTLQLMPISSASLKTETQKVQHLDEMVACFRKAESSSDYMIGWIDHFGKGEALGRGVFEQAVHIPAPEGKPLASYTPIHARFSVPCTMPGFLLNKYSMALYNKVRFAKVDDVALPEIQDFAGFFHPLDHIGNWNLLYGRRGFLQYQCIIPEGEKVVGHLRLILEKIQESGLFSFLAVLKYHGPHEGLLSFPMAGFSLALDFPYSRKVLQLLDKLDEEVYRMGGKIYLAKDARMKPEIFEKMYGAELPTWRRIVASLDPHRKIQSKLAERLKLR